MTRRQVFTTQGYDARVVAGDDRQDNGAPALEESSESDAASAAVPEDPCVICGHELPELRIRKKALTCGADCAKQYRRQHPGPS